MQGGILPLIMQKFVDIDKIDIDIVIFIDISAFMPLFWYLSIALAEHPDRGEARIFSRGGGDFFMYSGQ